MKPLPHTENPLVLRTDFSNQMTWEKICTEIQKPVGMFRFRANVEFLDDTEYAGLTKELVLERITKNYNHTYIFIVDRTTISHPDHPLVVMDLYDGSGHEFRAIPSQIQGIENNLSIANMDFEEFAEAVDEEGVFRGFPQS